MSKSFMSLRACMRILLARPGVRLGSAAAASLLLGGANLARAEQFILTDVTYTHSAATTSDSHYRVSPSTTTPPNWKSPVDYSTGSIHILLEVKTKPAGDTPTKFQVCLEGTPTYGCTLQSPTYTKTGRYEWNTKFSELWSPAGTAVDWTKSLNKVALIVKDTANGKPQGDPKYVPTELHVEVAVVSAGSTYTPPKAAVSDAGTPAPTSADAGVVDAAVREPVVDAAVDTPVVRTDAATPVSTPATRADSGSAAGANNTVLDSGVTAPADDDEPANETSSVSSGCAIASGSAGASGWLLALSMLLLGRRKKRAT